MRGGVPGGLAGGELGGEAGELGQPELFGPVGDTPAASTAAASISPTSERRSILRRPAKEVRTTRSRRASPTPSAGIGELVWRVKRTSTESTRGSGTNTARGTSPTMDAVPQRASNTVGMP